MSVLSAALEADGHQLFPSVFDAAQVLQWLAFLPEVTRGGERSLLDDARVQQLAAEPRLHALLAEGFFAVRAILFDKTKDTNWGLGWHQDTTVALRERIEVPGFGPWTVKDGVPHAVAPAPLLARMVCLRVHLDDCGPDVGPLRVKPGSHRSGRLSPEQVEEWCDAPEVTCLAARGDVLAFAPLLLHASSSSRSAGHRRVLQLEYARDPLPGGLRWRWDR